MFEDRKKLVQLSTMIFPMESRDEAGMLGESLALQTIQTHLALVKGHTRIYTSLRIPKPEGGGKYEIDLVILSSSALLLIEVKHWAGSIKVSEKTWEQHQGRQVKTWDNPLTLLHKKREALILWLHSQAFELDPKHTHALLVLTHPAVALEKTQAGPREILRLVDLADRMRELFGRPQQVWWRRSSAPHLDFHELKARLRRLPTWDVLELHGGQIWRGDILTVILRSSQRQIAFDRTSIWNAEVLCPRSLWSSFWLKPHLRISDWKGDTRTLPFDVTSRLTFQHGGQNRKEEIALIHLKNIELGWRDHSYYNTFVTQSQRVR